MGVRHSACATGAAGTARLVSAARIGDVEQLRAELERIDGSRHLQQVLDSHVAGGGPTPLTMSIFNNQLAAFEELLQAGADPNAKDGDGYNPLVIATRRADPRFASPLLAAGADVDLRHAHRKPGGRAGPGQQLRQVVEKGLTALHEAAWMNLREIIVLLLRSGAAVDVVTAEDRSTPLHVAAQWGRAAAATSLLEGGANPLALNKQKQTPLEVAKEHSHLALVEVLERWGSRVLTAHQRLALAQACYHPRLATRPGLDMLPYDVAVDIAAVLSSEQCNFWEEAYIRFVADQQGVRSKGALPRARANWEKNRARKGCEHSAEMFELE